MTFLFRAAGQRPGTANRPGKAQQAALQLLAPRRMRAAFSGQHTAKITVILTQRRRNVKPCPPAARPLPSAPKPLCRNDCKRLFYHSLPCMTPSCSPAFLRGRQPFRHQHLQGSFCSPYKDKYSAVLPGNAPPDLCVFLNLSFLCSQSDFFSKSPCISDAKVVCCIPQERILDTMPRIRSFVLPSSFFFLCYFLHLPSYHLPCLPSDEGKKAAALPARAAAFLFLL